LLIQCVSPLVPVVHIKNGILGTRGHVVSFFQDISGICTKLPRLPTDITMIKVVRMGVTVDGENVQNVFTINRSRILNALKWLKQHNPLYKDIIINESNLNWMTKSQSDIIKYYNHKTNYYIQKMNIMAVFQKTKHKLYSMVIEK